MRRWCNQSLLSTQEVRIRSEASFWKVSLPVSCTTGSAVVTCYTCKTDFSSRNVYPLLITVNTDDGSGYNSQEATFSTQKLFTIFFHWRTYRSDPPDSSHGGQHLGTELWQLLLLSATSGTSGCSCTQPRVKHRGVEQPQQWRTWEQPFLIFTQSLPTGTLHLRRSCNPFMSKQGADPKPWMY